MVVGFGVRQLLASLVVIFITFLFIIGETNAVDMQWQKPSPRSGSYGEVRRTLNDGSLLFEWYSPHIPNEEQYSAGWPGRAPQTGDVALITDVDIESDGSDDFFSDGTSFGLFANESESYTVTVREPTNRCRDMYVGGTDSQEFAVSPDLEYVIGREGSLRTCANTISFGEGLSFGQRGVNTFYLDANDSNRISVGEGTSSPRYWVIAVTFESEIFDDVNITDHEDGTFTVDYSADGVCGPAILGVGCNALSNNIPGSPFSINFFQCDPPAVEEAIISRNGVQLEIYFEYETNYGGFIGIFDCRDLLTFQTGMFGAEREIYCYWRTEIILIVVFGSRAFVEAGDRFIVLGGFIEGAPPLETPTLNQTRVTITQYEDPDPPRINIVGPELVPSCADTIILSATTSRGTGGREFVILNSDCDSDGDSDGNCDHDSDGDAESEGDASTGDDAESAGDDDDDDASEGTDEDSDGDDSDSFGLTPTPPPTPIHEPPSLYTYTPIRWRLVEPEDPYVESVLANLTFDDYHELVLEVDQLAYTNVEYVIKTRATNYLGVTSFSTHTFIVTSNDTAPTVQIHGPSETHMLRVSPLTLVCEAIFFCDEDILLEEDVRMIYNWTVATNAFDGQSIGFLSEELIDGTSIGIPEYDVDDVWSTVDGDNAVLYIPEEQFEFDYEYIFTCTAALSLDGYASGQDSTTIVIESGPLLPCSIDGNQRQVYSSEVFSMDASCSIDPNGENEEEPLKYQWCCEKNTFPFAGRECDNTKFPFGGFCSELSEKVVALQFNSNNAKFQTGSYIFLLRLVQGTRTAEYQIDITLVDDPIAIVHTEAISTYYSDPTSPIFLEGVVEQRNNLAINVAEQYWTVEPPYFELDGTIGTPYGLNYSFIYINPNSLLGGVRYDFTYHVRLEEVDDEGMAGVTVYAKERPQGGFCTTTESDESDVANRQIECLEYESDLDAYYFNVRLLDPLIGQFPFPSVQVQPLLAMPHYLLPPGTRNIFIDIINGLTTYTKKQTINPAIARPTYDYDSILAVINGLQVQNGKLRRYSLMLQISSFLLNLINYQSSYYEADTDAGYPILICITLDQLDDLRFFELRANIFPQFATYYDPIQDLRFYEAVAYVSEQTLTPCFLTQNQWLILEVLSYLDQVSFVKQLRTIRQTETAGTLFLKGMEAILLVIHSNETIWHPGACVRAGEKTWNFMTNLSKSYVIDGTPGVDPDCVQWDRVWYCEWKDLLDQPAYLIGPRQFYQYNGVFYDLSDSVYTKFPQGAEEYDTLMVTSDYSPYECKFRNEQTGAFSDFEILVDLDDPPSVTDLDEPIRIGIPQLIGPDERAGTDSDENVNPAYLDPETIEWLDNGITAEGYNPIYPGGPYVGTYIFYSSHLTVFGTIQDIPPPTPFGPDLGVIEVWWYALLVFCVLLFLIIGIVLPKMWSEFNRKKQAEREFFPDPEMMMDTFGRQDGFAAGWGEGEGGEEGYDEEYDEDYDEYEDEGEYDEDGEYEEEGEEGDE